MSSRRCHHIGHDTLCSDRPDHHDSLSRHGASQSLLAGLSYEDVGGAVDVKVGGHGLFIRLEATGVAFLD